MTRKIFTLLVVIVLAFETSAQDKVFNASDYLNRELSPKSISGLSWRPGLNSFTWIENESLMQKTVINPSKADIILKLDELNLKMKELKENELTLAFLSYHGPGATVSILLLKTGYSFSTFHCQNC